MKDMNWGDIICDKGPPGKKRVLCYGETHGCPLPHRPSIPPDIVSNFKSIRLDHFFLFFFFEGTV